MAVAHHRACQLGTATAQPAKTKTPLPALSALEVKAAALKKPSPTPLVSKQVKAAKMGVKEVDLGTPETQAMIPSIELRSVPERNALVVHTHARLRLARYERACTR